MRKSMHSLFSSTSPSLPTNAFVQSIFPIEIVEQIIAYVSDIHLLFELLTLSRATLAVVEAALYDTIDIRDAIDLDIPWKTYRRFLKLLNHLLANKRHAGLVHYIVGPMHIIPVVVTDPTPPKGLTNKFSKLTIFGSAEKGGLHTLHYNRLPAVLTGLRELDLPSSLRAFESAVQCPSSQLKKLILHSATLYLVIFRGDSETLTLLESLLKRQTKLKFLKLYSQSTHPLQDLLAPRRDDQPLLDIPQQIESIEGSLWLFSYMMPASVLPKKLRFWDRKDPYAQPPNIDQDFMFQRFRHLRVLSFCCSGNEKECLDSEILLDFVQLPSLEILELEFSPRSDFALIALLMTKIVKLASVSITELVITSARFQFLYIPSSVRLVELAFEEMQGLEGVEFGAGETYWRFIRGDQDPRPGRVRQEDWWIEV